MQTVGKSIRKSIIKGRVTQRIAPEGYQYIDRNLAKAVYQADKPITIHGNNINSYHVFEGCRLGYTIQRSDQESRAGLYDDSSLEGIVRRYMSYLEPELGKYVVYCVRKTDLTAYKAVLSGHRSTEQSESLTDVLKESEDH